MPDLQPLVDAADDAGLLLAVDGLCSTRDWDGLVDLARRCREAVELGKQLWPVAMHIDYRLALEAPAPYAASVLQPGAGRFALGPLTEVAACSHPWEDLAPHLSDPTTAAAVAQERVIRGEDLRGRLRGTPAELPACLVRFEPRYPTPSYRDRSAEFPMPAVATRRLPPHQPLQGAEPLPPDGGVRALRQVVETWEVESSGRVSAVAVEGDADAAIGCLAEEAALLQITATEAVALLQWAGASGGAYGRRRGGASGRFAAWWSVAALADVAWPEVVDEAFAEDVDDALAELRWYRWAPPGPEAGWTLRLAAADPLDGLAWAIEALDAREDALTVTGSG